MILVEFFQFIIDAVPSLCDNNKKPKVLEPKSKEKLEREQILETEFENYLHDEIDIRDPV